MLYCMGIWSSFGLLVPLLFVNYLRYRFRFIRLTNPVREFQLEYMAELETEGTQSTFLSSIHLPRVDSSPCLEYAK
jgi:hypothetical protein